MQSALYLTFRISTLRVLFCLVLFCDEFLSKVGCAASSNIIRMIAFFRVSEQDKKKRLHQNAKLEKSKMYE